MDVELLVSLIGERLIYVVICRGFTSLARVVTGPKQGYTLQKQSCRILVGICCRNIPIHTPQSGYHGVTEVAKIANIAKMAEKCINCTSARSSHSAPYKPPEVGTRKHFYGSKSKKKPKNS